MTCEQRSLTDRTSQGQFRTGEANQVGYLVVKRATRRYGNPRNGPEVLPAEMQPGVTRLCSCPALHGLSLCPQRIFQIATGGSSIVASDGKGLAISPAPCYFSVFGMVVVSWQLARASIVDAAPAILAAGSLFSLLRFRSNSRGWCFSGHSFAVAGHCRVLRTAPSTGRIAAVPCRPYAHQDDN